MNIVVVYSRRMSLQEQELREREEMKQKRRVKREHVIEELVQTEQDYLQSLTFTMHVFCSSDAQKVRYYENNLIKLSFSR